MLSSQYALHLHEQATAWAKAREPLAAVEVEEHPRSISRRKRAGMLAGAVMATACFIGAVSLELMAFTIGGLGGEAEGMPLSTMPPVRPIHLISIAGQVTSSTSAKVDAVLI